MLFFYIGCNTVYHELCCIQVSKWHFLKNRDRIQTIGPETLEKYGFRFAGSVGAGKLAEIDNLLA